MNYGALDFPSGVHLALVSRATRGDQNMDIYWRWRKWQWIPFWKAVDGVGMVSKPIFFRVHYGPLEIRKPADD